jgi:hypothetical protein
MEFIATLRKSLRLSKFVSEIFPLLEKKKASNFLAAREG